MTKKKKSAPVGKKPTGVISKAKSIKKQTPSFQLPPEQKIRTWNGQSLFLKSDDPEHLKKIGLLERTIQKRARLYCFKIRSHIVENRPWNPIVPEGWKEFVEEMPGFAGWDHFAVSWDIVGKNPFMIILRLQSIWDDWDQVMNRVAIPVNTPPEQLEERLEALSREYKKKK